MVKILKNILWEASLYRECCFLFIWNFIGDICPSIPNVDSVLRFKRAGYLVTHLFLLTYESLVIMFYSEYAGKEGNQCE